MPAPLGRTILSATQSLSTSSSNPSAPGLFPVIHLRPHRARQQSKACSFVLEIPARMQNNKGQQSHAGLKRKRTVKASTKCDTRCARNDNERRDLHASARGTSTLRPRRQLASSPAPSSSWSTGSASGSSSPISRETAIPSGHSDLGRGLRKLSLRTRSRDHGSHRPDVAVTSSDVDSNSADYTREKYFIRNASTDELNRLKKSDLVRLNQNAGTLHALREFEVTNLTKSELATTLINARKQRTRDHGRADLSRGRRRQLARVARSPTSDDEGSLYEPNWPVTDVGDDAGGEETDAEPVVRLRKGRGGKPPQRSQRGAALATGAAEIADEHSHTYARNGASRPRVYAASSPARTRGRLPRISRGPSALRNTIVEVEHPGRLPVHDESDWADTSPIQPKKDRCRRLGPHRRAKAQMIMMHQSDEEIDVDMAPGHDSDHEMDTDDADDDDEEGDRTAQIRKSPLASGDESTPIKVPQRQRTANCSRRVRCSRSSSSSLSPAPTTPETGSSRTHTPDQSDSDSDLTDQGESPSKMRKLRNGKVRLLSHSRSRSSGGEGSHNLEMAEGGDDTPIEKHMIAPTSTSLQRALRAELLALCAARQIKVVDTDKKADLIASLMEWWQRVHKRRSSLATSATSSGDDNKASVSTATRRPRRESQDKPLLMRSNLPAQSMKPPSPPLTSQNPDIKFPSDGVDELNGLDLEMLNLVDKEIPPSKLEKFEKIGSGGFKDVYVGKYHISKSRVNKVAIADIRDDLTEMDIKELSLLRDLRHENIVRFIGVSIPTEPRHVPCMIVSELCSNGDLFDYIRNVPAPDDEAMFRIMLETARGLAYLHAHTPSIIHRDVKSTNVLITQKGSAKINDFGLARVKKTTRSVIRSLVGTVNWQAVELWVPKPHYNEKVDVWSAAMTFWEVLQWHQPEKRYPFQGMNEHQIYLDVGQKGVRPSTASLRRQYGGEIVDLIDEMWMTSPKDRPTMQAVCERLEVLVEQKRQSRLAAQRAAKTSR